MKGKYQGLPSNKREVIMKRGKKYLHLRYLHGRKDPFVTIVLCREDSPGLWFKGMVVSSNDPSNYVGRYIENWDCEQFTEID